MTKRQAKFGISFIHLKLRATGTHAARIWTSIPSPMFLDGDPAAPIADVIDRAVRRVRDAFADHFAQHPSEYDEVRRALAERIAPFDASATVDARTVLDWLTEPSGTRCRYRHADGSERLMPFALGHTSYRLSSTADLGDFLKLEANSRTLSIVDTPDSRYDGGVQDADLPYLFIQIDTHWGVNALFDFANPPVDPRAFGLLSTWGPVAAGASFVRNLVPSALWESLNDDERWILEDAATVLIADQLPVPPWLLAPTTALADWSRDGAWPVDDLLGRLGLHRARPEPSYFDPHILVEDLSAMARYRFRTLYSSIKRVLGLLEYRILRSTPECLNDCNNRPVNRGRPCKDVGKRWLGDTLRLKAAPYDRARGAGGWGGKIAIPSRVSLSQVIEENGPTLPEQPIVFPLPTDDPDGDPSWSLALERVRAAAVAETGEVVIGALGQFVLQLRNLCEHGAPTTTSTVSLRPDPTGEAVKNLRLQAVEELAVSHADIDVCLRLMIMLLRACQTKGLLLFQTFASFKLTRSSSPSPEVTHSSLVTGTSIEVWVLAGTDVTALIATFSITGARVFVAGKEQHSGVTANNFTGPIIYTVEGADGTERDFLVTVLKAA